MTKIRFDGWLTSCSDPDSLSSLLFSSSFFVNIRLCLSIVLTLASQASERKP